MLQLLFFNMTTLLEHSASETKMLRTPDSRKTNLTKSEAIRSIKLKLKYCEKATKFEKISNLKKSAEDFFFHCSGAHKRVD